MKYSLTATPSPAILGSPVTVTLRALADTEAPQALTFEHQSLTIELSRPGWTREPLVAIPNRRVIQEKGILLREASAGGIEDLRAGETRSRDFALNNLFPLEILNAGEVTVTFSLADQRREFRPEPIRLQVFSGPAAVAALFGVLNDNEAARRARAATLLHRMTLHGMDYNPFAEGATRSVQAGNWQNWWDSTGNRLPWNYQADGATLSHPGPPPSSRLSSRLGGIVFRQMPWSDHYRRAVLAAIEEWRKNPALSSLQGNEQVADAVITYPPEGALFEADGTIGDALTEAMGQLEALTRFGDDHAREGDVLLATVAAAPYEIFAGPLTRLANLIPETPKWARARLRCEALRDSVIPYPNRAER